MDIALDDVWHFDIITSNPSTGAVSDADSTPTFEVFEEATDTAILTGQSMTKRTGKTGNYRGSVTCSAANGFEAGKWYSTVPEATVAGIAGKDQRNFRIRPAETSAGVPKVDASIIDGDLTAAGLLAGLAQDYNTDGYLAANLMAMRGVAQSAIDLTDFADAGYDPATNQVEGVKLVAGFTAAGKVEIEQEAIDALQARGVTTTRTAYLDKLNISGNVASQSDVQSINVGASRRILVTTSADFERPSSGSLGYQIEVRTYDTAGNPVAADTTPTLTATGVISGNLSGNLSAASNPSTGVYHWTYTVTSSATKEQIRFEASATLSAVTFTLATFADVTDAAATDFTSADRTKLDAIHAKLPSKAAIAGTANATGDIQLDGATGALALDAIVAATIAGSAVTKIQAGLSTLTLSTVRDAVGLANANLDTQLSGINAKTTNLPASPAAVGSAMTLTGGERDAIATAQFDLSNGVETGVTYRQYLRRTGAVIAGKVSGAGGGTETFVGLDGLTTRVIVTADANGNRTAVNYL